MDCLRVFLLLGFLVLVVLILDFGLGGCCGLYLVFTGGVCLYVLSLVFLGLYGLVGGRLVLGL